MSDTPKFEVIDRRKYKADEEARETQTEPANPPAPQPQAEIPEPPKGPRLVTQEPYEEDLPAEETAGAGFAGLPAPPTPEESREQKSAYDASSQRLEDLVRAQNPGAGPQPPVTFEALVQQFYLSAMIQMGAGTREGERPRVDILGAKQTIDMLGILAEKTRGNVSPAEDRMLQSVLYEARMAFLELTSMISMPGVPPTPPPGKGKP